ncbi:MAG TPA: hypothetical protein VEX11_08185 [Acetobacteraceae bacterium]|nr:hypothetical protein [Acetobacteraceae bacterium]
MIGRLAALHAPRGVLALARPLLAPAALLLGRGRPGRARRARRDQARQGRRGRQDAMLAHVPTLPALGSEMTGICSAVRG